MAVPASRVILLALASRAAVLAALLLSDRLFADLDSSARLQASHCAGADAHADAAGAFRDPAAPASPLLSLAVWDTVYFARVARCGYETDKINAFFPLLPGVMRGFGGSLAGLLSWEPAEAAYVLAGLAANAIAFCCAALCFHRLGGRMLGSAAAGASCTADIALLLFCLNPASVFYSAAYSEALFAACTWAGLLLLPTRHWAGVAALTAAAAARSNGVLGLWFPLHKLLAEWRRRGRLPAGAAARAVLSCCCILAPYVAMQAQAYAAHCLAGPRPAWCGARPPSVYSFIQREYWDVGLLRFYRDPARWPMVLMSLPVAWLSVGGCWAYFAADWRRALTLGLYRRGDALPPGLAWAETVLARMVPPCGDRGSSHGDRQPARRKAAAAPAATALQRSQDAAPLMYHWALMAAVALLAMHVNVATRFLSACPPLYWHAAEWAGRSAARARLVWLWCLAYTVLGCLLFPNFYPWC